jgi:chemotaxis signal transduction protein
MASHGGTTLAATCGAFALAAPIEGLVEITRPSDLAPSNDPDPAVIGVATLRGRAVPVVDLASVLFGERSTSVARLVSVRGGATVVAFAVDSVEGLAKGAKNAADAVPFFDAAKPGARARLEAAAPTLARYLDGATVVRRARSDVAP